MTATFQANALRAPDRSARKGDLGTAGMAANHLVLDDSDDGREDRAAPPPIEPAPRGFAFRAFRLSFADGAFSTAWPCCTRSAPSAWTATTTRPPLATPAL